MDNKDIAILQLANERKDEKPSDISAFRTFLEYAMKVVPTLESIKLTANGMQLYNSETTTVTKEMLGGLLFAINQFISATTIENVENGWAFLDTDTLLDGLKAMHFYAVISNNCPYITAAYDRILQHLRVRIDDSVLRPKIEEFIASGIDMIKKADAIYIVYHNALGEKIPMIDPTGSAWVFINEDYAEIVIKDNSNIPLTVKKYSLQDFEDIMHFWRGIGIEKMRLKTGTGDNEPEITVSEYLKIETPKFEGSFLNYLLIRARQTENIETLKKLHLTIWGVACRKMTDSLYLVPISYDDDNGEPVEDRYVHTSMRAAERMIKLQIEKQLGMSLDNYMVDVKAKEGENNPLVGQTFENFTSGEVPFFGCENYSFAHAQTGDAIQIGKTMRLQTAVNNGHAFLPLFTDMKTLHTVFGDKVRIGLFTWEDIVARINDLAENPDGSTSAIEGIVINPGLTNIQLSVDNVMSIEAEKNKLNTVLSGTNPDAGNNQKNQKEQIAKQYGNIPQIKKEIGLCTASLVLGIISLIFDFTPITGLLALIFGIIGRNKALKEKQDGASKALAGIVLGAVSMVSRLMIIIILIINA